MGLYPEKKKFVKYETAEEAAERMEREGQFGVRCADDDLYGFDPAY